MAKDMNAPAIPAAIGNVPANWDSHHQDQANRKAARDKKRKSMLRCLDPLEAAAAEQRKPLYEWQVECEIFRPAGSKGRAGTKRYSEQVVAKTEGDAWAMFCDKIGDWPSRRDANATITKLQKRTNED